MTVDASQDGVKAWVPIPGPVMQVKCSEERTVAELWRAARAAHDQIIQDEMNALPSGTNRYHYAKYGPIKSEGAVLNPQKLLAELKLGTGSDLSMQVIGQVSTTCSACCLEVPDGAWWTHDGTLLFKGDRSTLMGTKDVPPASIAMAR